MNKTLLLLTILSLFASQANASLLIFDDIPEGSIQGSIGNMPTYEGFNFSSRLMWIDVEGYSWYRAYGAQSGEFALLNNSLTAGIITEANGENFIFDGLWAKKWGTPKDSAGIDSLFGTLQGYSNGALTWSVATGLNGSYEYYGAQLGLIDELRLDFGYRFLVDDIELTRISTVPEPSSIALMLGGLGFLGFMAARRAKKG